jgi:drug/metabolite transporter (DMT)-like permease
MAEQRLTALENGKGDWSRMVRGILLALAAATIYGFLGISFEIAAKRRYPVWDVILYKQLTGFVIGLGFTAALGLSLYNRYLMGLGLLGAIAYVITVAAYLTASRERDIAANWTIVNLSVALPILVSIVWFKDAFTLMKAIGVLLTLGSIALIGGHSPTSSGTGTQSRWLKFISIAFLLNGVLVILFRFVPEGYAALFTVYFYGISFLLVLPYKLYQDSRLVPPGGLFAVSAAAAPTHWSGIMLTMAALSVAGRVSPNAGVIIYPITNGLVIPIGVLLGVWLLNQKLAGRTVVGVALGMAALVFLFLP